VFTYLHVSDSYRSTGRVLEVVSPTHAAGQDVTTSSSSSSFQGVTAYNHNRFKPSSLFKTKEPIRSKKENQRRSSLLGTVGLERRAKESQSNSKLQVFIKKNTLPVNSVIDKKSNSFPEDNLPNAIKTSSGPVKNICSYFFSLPKRFHNNVLDVEYKEEIQPVQICDDSNNQTIPSAQML
ncbi:hypothetical protein M9458_023359, partial [Cirrhinus mrigala]